MFNTPVWSRLLLSQSIQHPIGSVMPSKINFKEFTESPSLRKVSLKNIRNSKRKLWREITGSWGRVRICFSSINLLPVAHSSRIMGPRYIINSLIWWEGNTSEEGIRRLSLQTCSTLICGKSQDTIKTIRRTYLCLRLMIMELNKNVLMTIDKNLMVRLSALNPWIVQGIAWCLKITLIPTRNCQSDSQTSVSYTETKSAVPSPDLQEWDVSSRTMHTSSAEEIKSSKRFYPAYNSLITSTASLALNGTSSCRQGPSTRWAATNNGTRLRLNLKVHLISMENSGNWIRAMGLSMDLRSI